MRSWVFLFLLLLSGGAWSQEAFTLCYPNGKVQEEGTRTNNHKKGTIYYYDEKEFLIKKVNYTLTYRRPGEFNGYQYKEQVYFYDAKENVLRVQEFENGKDVTKSLNTYPNGQLKSETEKEPDGNIYKITTYYDNGKVQYINRYIEGQGGRKISHGEFQSYYKNGQMSSQGVLDHGKKVGVRYSWNEEGKLLDEFVYENDTAVSIKRFNAKGVQTQNWSKYTDKSTHFYRNYYSGDSVLQSYTYYRTYDFDTLQLELKFIETYDRKTGIPYVSVSNDTPGNNYQILYGPDQIAGPNHIGSYAFHVNRVPHYKDTVFDLGAGFRMEQQGFYIKNGLKFPINASLKEMDQIIEDAMAEVWKNMKENKVNENYRLKEEMIPVALAYYKKFPREVFYEKTQIYSELDSTGSGLYRIDYLGTDMYFICTLKEGFVHGLAQLYLNDHQLLFERHYFMGIAHGISRDWFLTGELCSEITFYLGRKKDEKLYFTNGQLWKREINDPKLGLVGKQIYREDGNALEFSSVTDTLNMGFLFNKDLSFHNFGYNDKKNGISLHRTWYKERNFATINIPHIADTVFRFRIDTLGVVVEGEAWWDPVLKKANLKDNYGEVGQFDPTVISYPKELPCTCKGWEEHKFFAQSTADFVNEKEFLKYQYNFHLPIDNLKHVFGNPYYPNTPPDEYRLGHHYSTYSYHFLAKPLSIFLPDSNGVELVIEPCKSRFAFIKLHVSTEFRIGNIKETKAIFHDVKHVALKFPSNILTQVDDEFKLLFNDNSEPYSGMFMFTAGDVKYDYEKEINVTYPNFMPGRKMRVGNTGLILDTWVIQPDFSSTENYKTMNHYWIRSNRSLDSLLNYFKINWKEIETFRGGYITEGRFFLPGSTDDPPYIGNVNQLLVSADQVFGEVSIDVLSDTNGRYAFQNSDGFSDPKLPSDMTGYFSNNGIRTSQPVYDPARKRITFFIQYKQ